MLSSHGYLSISKHCGLSKVVDGLMLVYRARRWVHPGKWDNPTTNLAHYRQELDLLEPERVLWNPCAKEKDHGAEEVHQRVLDWEAFETALCRKFVEFDNIVEWYLPDWVLGQFGLRQHPRVSQ
ncbi:hypothetical protein AMTRI_Chr02g258400 [Amborella trichopoda]